MIRTPIYSELPARRSPVRRDGNLVLPRGAISHVERPAEGTPAAPAPATAAAEEQPAAETEEPAREASRDDYLTKLIKYVPAEAVAAFVAVIALTVTATENAGTQRALLQVVFWIFLVATPIYFWIGARKLPEKDQPV